MENNITKQLPKEMTKFYLGDKQYSYSEVSSMGFFWKDEGYNFTIIWKTGEKYDNYQGISTVNTYEVVSYWKAVVNGWDIYCNFYYGSK